MKLDNTTTQAELQKLYATIVRREFLKGTPLNIKPFLRYTLLFLLFPGMILGFWVGFAITAAFCVLLITLLALNYVSVALVAALSWFSLGLLPISYVTLQTYRKAARTRKLRLLQREPLGANPAKACVPQNMPLKWQNLRRKNNTVKVAKITINAPQSGIYVMLLTMPDYNGARLLSDGPAGMCIMQKNAKKGGELSALLLYNLKEGAHEISWSITSADDRPAPQSYITQINCDAH